MAKAIKKITKGTEDASLGGEPKNKTLDRIATAVAYNYFSYFNQYDDAIEFLKSWAKNNKPDLLSKIKLAKKHEIPQNVGWIAKLKSNNCILTEETNEYFNKKLNEIGKITETSVIEKNAKLKSYENASILRLEEIHDNILMGKIKDFDAHSHFKSFPTSVVDLKSIQDYYSGNLEQLTDKSNSEYFNHSKIITSNLINFYTNVLAACQNNVVIKKREHKPRKAKTIPIAKKIALLRFMKESKELKINSLSPDKILTSSELYIYNAKNKKIIYLVANEGKKFSVHRSAIIDVDADKSFIKTLRSPEKNIQKFVSGTKHTLKKNFESLTTVASPIEKVQTNDSMILMRVF